MGLQRPGRLDLLLCGRAVGLPIFRGEQAFFGSLASDISKGLPANVDEDT